MKTLTEIQEEITTTISDLNAEGDVIELLGKLLAYSIYNNEILCTSTVLESSPNRCQYIDSAIVHAQGKGYSVFRGSNQRIKLWDENDSTSGLITVNLDYSVNKFDVALEIDGVKLVYAQDYSFWTDVTNKDTTQTFQIELVATEYIYEKTITVDNYTTTHILIAESNISEDISLSNNGVELDWTSNYAEFLADTSKILVLTDSDYGISLFNINKFSVGDTITLKWIPYTDSTVSLDSIKVIDQFELPEDVDSYSDLVSSSNLISPLSKMSDKSLIYLYSTNCFLGNFQLRSSSDLQYIINNYFDSYISKCTVTYIWSDTDSAEDKIIVDYILKDDVVYIPTTMIDAFIVSAKTIYNIPDTFEFNDISENCIISGLSITIYYSGDNPQSLVNSVIADWKTKVNETFNIYRLLADLQDTGMINYTNVDKTPTVTLPTVDDSYKFEFEDLSISYSYEG